MILDNISHPLKSLNIIQNRNMKVRIPKETNICVADGPFDLITFSFAMVKAEDCCKLTFSLHP